MSQVLFFSVNHRIGSSIVLSVLSYGFCLLYRLHLPPVLFLYVFSIVLDHDRSIGRRRG